jgi:hypothetical protein
MGYRLYMAPLPGQGSAGALDASYAGSKLSLQGAAGTFLVVLGTVIVLVGLLKPISLERDGPGDVVSATVETIPDTSAVLDTSPSGPVGNPGSARHQREQRSRMRVQARVQPDTSINFADSTAAPMAADTVVAGD